MRTPKERKIPEWDEKLQSLQTNKLTLIGICQIFMHSEKQKKRKKKSDFNLVVLILSAE